MIKRSMLAVALSGACCAAGAADVLLVGHVQQLILQPRGTEHCEPQCPSTPVVRADGAQTVCVSNGGGCEIVEIKVDHVYRGQVEGPVRVFSASIGEWGETFPVTDAALVVSESRGNVYWSRVREREGRLFVDPKRLRSIGGVSVARPNDAEWLALDEVLARSQAAPSN